MMVNQDGVQKRLCYARPVRIGNDCWFGANVVVCSGVTIGDGCVIGAGSVVVKDIPAHTFAGGNPCRVIRELSLHRALFRPPLRTLGSARPGGDTFRPTGRGDCAPEGARGRWSPPHGAGRENAA